ncbi:2-oxo acid dehydrogenase subunit E2 [Fulvivirga sp. M361]|uniref:dihydrolipoamide acetyltransferase family protein n=1 Tax=Fulvivirga sp. M361 TaxID=2594266 RepID=UPI00117ABFCD|nr:dihydrolipoamide acetyltransferase family protein [Fulvivirga sp. M361]TRX58291.1 2-oxo acid dehydrogenase subunit E2 [Fulvivirga sp. M361]
MALVELLMPKMGESIIEATVLSWLKKEGDTIEQDESILEVATDKVDTEVPSTHGGILKEILAKDGEVIEVGKAIAVIATDDEVEKTTNTPAAEPVMEEVEEIPLTSGNGQSQANGMLKTNSQTSSERFYSPLVKNIAHKEGIALTELETVPGSGKEGRVTKKDILNYVETRKDAIPKITQVETVAGTELVATKTETKVNVSVNAKDEIIEMDRMRKVIAERMVDSKRTSPHVTSFVEADVTNVVFWRNRNKQAFKQQEGGNLTFTPIFVEAVARAIKDYPMINIQVQGDKIIKKKDINIGMAVALPSGNLIVPVIKNADQLNLTGLANKVNDLARRARHNKLSPDELSGGTFTISNVGSFGNVMGTPIILQPQVGIIALGAVIKKPAVIETPLGDTIGIRHKMFLSHSYDHRVVDGSLGGMVVRRVADYLEKFDLNRGL